MCTFVNMPPVDAILVGWRGRSEPRGQRPLINRYKSRSPSKCSLAGEMSLCGTARVGLLRHELGCEGTKVRCCWGVSSIHQQNRGHLESVGCYSPKAAVLHA